MTIKKFLAEKRKQSTSKVLVEGYCSLGDKDIDLLNEWEPASGATLSKSKTTNFSPTVHLEN